MNASVRLQIQMQIKRGAEVTERADVGNAPPHTSSQPVHALRARLRTCAKLCAHPRGALEGMYPITPSRPIFDGSSPHRAPPRRRRRGASAVGRISRQTVCQISETKFWDRKTKAPKFCSGRQQTTFLALLPTGIASICGIYRFKTLKWTPGCTS